ncbi:MAG: hypothetical protein QXM52_01200 [Candidatus Bathyarchaeia archaeon]
MGSIKGFAKYAAVFFAVFAILSLLFWNLNQILFLKNISQVEDYDYTVYADAANIKVKNGTTGQVDFIGNELSQVLSAILKNDGLKVFIKTAEYNISSSIRLQNLTGVKIVSNGARLNLNGNSLIIAGDHWEYSKYNSIEGLTIVNGSIVIENSFRTTIKNCVFINSWDGIVLSNTNGWTECTVIEHSYFINVQRGIVFRKPINNGTKSYANTEIRGAWFELRREGAIGIHVEPKADFNEGLIQNVRVWMGSVVERNQMGILVEGSMLNTLMQNVVFESFANDPQSIYGISLGKDSDPPILGQGIVFCGNLTSSIYNPHGKWLYGSSGSFRIENILVPLGVNNIYGEPKEIGAVPHLSLAISALNVKVQIDGNFSAEETVYVRLRFKFIDDSFSKHLEISFNKTGIKWLSNDDWLDIWPTRTIISSLVVDAKTTAYSSNVTVIVSAYGQYG